MNDYLIPIGVSALTAAIISGLYMLVFARAMIDQVRVMDPKLLDLMNADRLIKDNIKMVNREIHWSSGTPENKGLEFKLKDLIDARLEIAKQISNRKAIDNDPREL